MTISFTFAPDVNEEALGVGNEILPLSLAGKVGLLDRTSFSHLLVETGQGSVRNLEVAANVLRRTHALRVIAVISPDDISPLDAAQAIATIDQASEGRISVKLEVGRQSGDDALGHAEAYQRLDEFIVVLKRLWSNDAPITLEGAFYRLDQAHVPAKGPQRSTIPIWIHAATGSAIQVAARHAAVVQLHAGSVEDIRLQVQRLRDSALKFGRERQLRFALSARDGGGRPRRRGTPTDDRA